MGIITRKSKKRKGKIVRSKFLINWMQERDQKANFNIMKTSLRKEKLTEIKSSFSSLHTRLGSVCQGLA